MLGAVVDGGGGCVVVVGGGDGEEAMDEVREGEMGDGEGDGSYSYGRYSLWDRVLEITHKYKFAALAHTRSPGSCPRLSRARPSLRTQQTDISSACTALQAGCCCSCSCCCSCCWDVPGDVYPSVTAVFPAIIISHFASAAVIPDRHLPSSFPSNTALSAPALPASVLHASHHLEQSHTEKRFASLVHWLSFLQEPHDRVSLRGGKARAPS